MVRSQAGRFPRIFLWVLAVSSIVSIALVGPGARAEVRSVYDIGAPGLIQALERVLTIASVLHTGAHPDDEDSALVARLARGDHARIAYLSLTRGGGGQNVIGPELFEGLGVIRTEELLQARRLDGGEQFFGRAFDFGFSKSREEAARKWGEQIMLSDMVRAIRMYRPLVVISRFTGTPDDGHGHHQFAGFLTPIAFQQAGDPTRFPEQLKDGLRPWKPLKLYVSHRSRPDSNRDAGLSIETGELNRPVGRTYFEIAMQGRSQHKSQGMGTLELHGPQSSGVKLLEAHVGVPAVEHGLFDGIDTTLHGVAAIAGLPPGLLDEELSEARAAVESGISDFNILEPETILPRLASGLGAIRRARRELIRATALSEQQRYDAEFLLSLKENELAEALQVAAGVVIDALVDTETVTEREKARVEVRVFYPDASPVRVGKVELHTPQGWIVEDAGPEPPGSGRDRRPRVEKGRHESFFEITVSRDAPLTEPYWLDTPRTDDVYSWTVDDPRLLPFGPRVAEALVSMDIAGASIAATRNVQHRYADPARGEIRRDLNVVPAVSVTLDSDLLIVPTASRSRRKRLVVRVENHSSGKTNGTVRLEMSPGWTSDPGEASFELERKGEETSLAFSVNIPEDSPAGPYTIAVRATSDGHTFDRQMHTIAYPHIQTHRFYTPAVATAQVVDLEVADVRVGYIMGSGDRVPEAVRRMGVDVTFLDDEYLATGDLSRFDTIIVGIRAAEVRPDFVANNGRLMAFMRNGGTLIVQYQRPDYAEGDLTPYPAEMSRPESFSNYRVTDETATVTVLQPEHPVFNFPNRILPEDWEGWVQERSLYHLTDLDPRYTPLTEAADPGEEPHRGALVYTKVGKGRYVYTGLSFFRQLPAGVPGAYRLFANLISLSNAPSAEQE